MIKIDLNPLKSSGLFNQLFSLVNAIIIGVKLSKNIYIEYFYPLYNNDNKIDINEIININKTNINLQQLKIKLFTKSDLNIDINWNNDNINCLIPFKQDRTEERVFNEINKLQNIEFININDTFGVYFARNKNFYYIFYNILKDIVFSNKIYENLDLIIKNYKIPIDFKSVHLRLEDDYWREAKEKIIYLFNQEFKNYNKNDFIFISTGLNPKDKYYYILEEFKKIYPNSIILNKTPEIREIDAIYDYLICIRSNEFLGIIDSTFSEVINYNFLSTNRKTKIINFMNKK